MESHSPTGSAVTSGREIRVENIIVLTVIESFLLTHKRDKRVSCAVKYVALRVGLVEAAAPESLEVDSVRENEGGRRGDSVVGNEVLYLSFRRVTDPLVDSIARRLGVGPEVGFLELVAEEIEHALPDLLLLAYPQPVGALVLVTRGRIPLRLKFNDQSENDKFH